MRSGDRFRLRRSSLAQPDRKDDDAEDGQEFALPVLEGLEPELRG